VQKIELYYYHQYYRHHHNHHHHHHHHHQQLRLHDRMMRVLILPSLFTSHAAATLAAGHFINNLLFAAIALHQNYSTTRTVNILQSDT
jgi:hypothetical protein